MEDTANRPRTFLDCFKLNPEERQFLLGRGDVAFARKTGFVHALAAAALCAAVSFVPFARSLAGLGDPRLCLASAALYFALGVMVRQGKAWGALALMALVTISMGSFLLHAWRLPGAHYADHPAHWTYAFIISLLVWALWVRIFSVVYALERRTAMAGK